MYAMKYSYYTRSELPPSYPYVNAKESSSGNEHDKCDLSPIKRKQCKIVSLLGFIVPCEQHTMILHCSQAPRKLTLSRSFIKLPFVIDFTWHSGHRGRRLPKNDVNFSSLENYCYIAKNSVLFIVERMQLTMRGNCERSSAR